MQIVLQEAWASYSKYGIVSVVLVGGGPDGEVTVSSRYHVPLPRRDRSWSAEILE
jgi:hypothetical protein